MDNIVQYCRDCEFLSVKEHEQKVKDKHIFKKYNKQVKHLGHHPELPRLEECDEPLMITEAYTKKL